jgi:hypothetical protein
MVKGAGEGMKNPVPKGNLGQRNFIGNIFQ